MARTADEVKHVLGTIKVPGCRLKWRSSVRSFQRLMFLPASIGLPCSTTPVSGPPSTTLRSQVTSKPSEEHMFERLFLLRGWNHAEPGECRIPCFIWSEDWSCNYTCVDTNTSVEEFVHLLQRAQNDPQEAVFSGHVWNMTCQSQLYSNTSWNAERICPLVLV